MQAISAQMRQSKLSASEYKFANLAGLLTTPFMIRASVGLIAFQ